MFTGVANPRRMLREPEKKLVDREAKANILQVFLSVYFFTKEVNGRLVKLFNLVHYKFIM